MTDREKVIRGLECCIAYDYKCNDCPYRDDGGAADGCYSDELKADALALLKAQESIRPNEIWQGNVLVYYQCSACTSTLLAGDKYCAWCGRKVKWES